MKIILVDRFKSLVDAAGKIGWDVEKHAFTDIKDVPMEKGYAFVSPANSLGFMDGGIDYVLSRVMFKDIEPKVKSAFKQLGYISELGRPYCPIGKAVRVPTEFQGIYLIAAPTMWLPQDVHKTNNAYHAMYAILKECDESVQTLVVPGLCTGCGMMTAMDAICKEWLYLTARSALAQS